MTTDRVTISKTSDGTIPLSQIYTTGGGKVCFYLFTPHHIIKFMNMRPLKLILLLCPTRLQCFSFVDDYWLLLKFSNKICFVTYSVFSFYLKDGRLIMAILFLFLLKDGCSLDLPGFWLNIWSCLALHCWNKLWLICHTFPRRFLVFFNW